MLILYCSFCAFQSGIIFVFDVFLLVFFKGGKNNKHYPDLLLKQLKKYEVYIFTNKDF